MEMLPIGHTQLQIWRTIILVSVLFFTLHTWLYTSIEREDTVSVRGHAWGSGNIGSLDTRTKMNTVNTDAPKSNRSTLLLKSLTVISKCLRPYRTSACQIWLSQIKETVSKNNSNQLSMNSLYVINSIYLEHQNLLKCISGGCFQNNKGNDNILSCISHILSRKSHNLCTVQDLFRISDMLEKCSPINGSSDNIFCDLNTRSIVLRNIDLVILCFVCPLQINSSSPNFDASSIKLLQRELASNNTFNISSVFSFCKSLYNFTNRNMKPFHTLDTLKCLSLVKYSCQQILIMFLQCVKDFCECIFFNNKNRTFQNYWNTCLNIENLYSWIGNCLYVNVGKNVKNSDQSGNNISDPRIDMTYDVGSMCSTTKFTTQDLTQFWDRPVITDVALVIAVSDGNFSTAIPFLEYIHRPFFKHIVYCIVNVELFKKFIKEINRNDIRYISLPTQNMTFSYQCVSLAMELSLEVKGYLFVKGHMLLNSWKLVDLPRDYFWMPEGFSKRSSYRTKTLNHWLSWNDKNQRHSLTNVLETLRNTRNTWSENSQSGVTVEFKKFAGNFLDIFMDNLKSDFVLFHQIDLFYVPALLSTEFSLAVGVFVKGGLTIDSAISVIHFGLTRNILYLARSSLTGENSRRPWFYFNKENGYFIHPYNIHTHMKSKTGQRFMCNKYLRTYHTELLHYKSSRVV